MHTAGEVQDRYERTLRARLPFAGSAPLQPTQRLAELGLDSLGIITLVAEFEDAFDVEIPDELLTAGTFATVGSLRAALSDLLLEHHGSAAST